MKGVFDTRPDTGYDDDIVRRYHFLNRYLPVAERCVEDWIVYRETRRGSGRPGYVSVARVKRLEPDPSDPGSSYAHVTDYLRFDVIVPLRRATRYFEERLRSVADPKRVGVALQGQSVRTISDADFGAIVRVGLRETLDPLNLDELERAGADAGVHAFVGASPEEQERRIVQMLVNRPFRDAAFRTSVVSAYRETCAVTGLRIVNGGGKVEVQAAHIWSVKDGGAGHRPERARSLSATCHWLFDRHLISLTDDYGLLVSHNRVPGELRGLFAKQLDRIDLPSDERQWPRRDFIALHRKNSTDSERGRRISAILDAARRLEDLRVRAPRPPYIRFCPSGCHPPAQGLRSLTGGGSFSTTVTTANRRQIAAAARTVSVFDIATECGWGHGDSARAPDLLEQPPHRAGEPMTPAPGRARLTSSGLPETQGGSMPPHPDPFVSRRHLPFRYSDGRGQGASADHHRLPLALRLGAMAEQKER